MKTRRSRSGVTPAASAAGNERKDQEKEKEKEKEKDCLRYSMIEDSDYSCPPTMLTSRLSVFLQQNRSERCTLSTVHCTLHTA